MFSLQRSIHIFRAALPACAFAALLVGAPSWAQTTAASTTATPVNGRALEAILSDKLTVAPGKVLTAQIVHYPPGGASKAHHHDADVFAFVLSGNIRSQTEGHGDAQVYHAGEGRFERRGDHHIVSENASKTEPASMLVVFIHDEKAKLTTFDH
jgi:quercetin dioxygenase-like cupin family protein